MSEKLVIRLGTNSEQKIPWIIWSENQSQVISSGILPDAKALISLTERAGGRPVDVLVDTSAVNLTQVELPAKAQRQALKALPFMLEEELAQDVDLLHFVPIGQTGEQLSVAVVGHEQMQQWQGWLLDANLVARCMVPDVLAVPQVPETDLSLLELEGQKLLRTATYTGMVLTSQWCEFAYPQLAESHPQWALFSQEATPEAAVVVQQPLELPMQLLAQGLAGHKANLLTGIYAPKRESNKYWTTWRPALIASSVLLLVVMLNSILQLQSLKQERALKRAESVQIYRQLFPSETRVIDPRGQLQAKLRALPGSNSKGEFLSMMSDLQPIFAESPVVRPQNIRFDASRAEIRLQLQAETFSQLETFTQQAQQVFDASVGAMNNESEGVSGTLTVKVK